MFQPKRWWIGLLPLGLIWAAANWVETPRVEQDLLTRARQAIASSSKDITRSDISVAGRDITIHGEAVQGSASEKAAGAAQDINGTRIVHAAISAAQLQRPYYFAAEREGNRLTLSGFAPTTDAKDRILAAAKGALAAVAINDQIKLGAGAPPQFEIATGHGLQQLSRLSKGKFSLTDQSYSLEGAAVDSPAYGTLARLGNALPAGFKPGTIAITAPAASAYAFEAKREGNNVVLSGFVPDQATRDRLLAGAKAAYPGLAIEDKLAFASGAPQGFEAMAVYGLALAGKLGPGIFGLAGNSYSLTGNASDAATYEAALAAAKSLPAGANAGKFDIQPPEIKPYGWTVRRNDDGSITIEGAAPDAATRDALLAQAAKLYPGARIDNKMQIARTAPAGFAAAAAVGLEIAGKLKGGGLSLSDANVSLAGEAVDQAAGDSIGKWLAGISNNFKVPGIAVPVAIPEVKPYAFGIRRLEDGTVVLEGAVPDAATRDALLAQAAKLYPGAKIDNKMQIARTAPAGFAAAAAAGLEIAGKLKGGGFSLTDGVVSLAGEAVDATAAGAISKLLAGIGNFFKLPGAAVAVAIPDVKPYAWGIRRLADGSMVLEGSVPDAATRDGLLAQATALYPGIKIENRMQIARTAPAGFAGAAAIAVAQAGKLKSGVLSILDGLFSLSGEAQDQAAAEAINTALGGAGSGFKLASGGAGLTFAKPIPPAAPPPPEPVVVAPPPAPVVAVQPPAVVPARAAALSCQSRGSAPLAQGFVYFSEGSHVLTPSENGKLQELLARLKACGGANVELYGHTNSNGDRVRNIQLSTLRTFAVSRWLQENRIAKKRIITLGYGEDRLPVPDSTPDAMAKNRRVEINIR